MVKRILWNVILAVLVVWAPWWAAFGWGIIGAVMFPWYIEIIVAGAVFDAIYGGIPGVWQFKHTVVFLIPFVVIELIKPRLNFSRKNF